MKRFKMSDQQIRKFCKKHHIVYLGLFGSILTPRFNKSSDIDILVKFDKKHMPSLFDMVDMEEELTALLGRKVDLRTPGDLSRYFRQEVLDNAKVLYDQRSDLLPRANPSPLGLGQPRVPQFKFYNTL